MPFAEAAMVRNGPSEQNLTLLAYFDKKYIHYNKSL